MGKSGQKLIEGFREALAVAQGAVAAARITENGHSYVPETPLTKAAPDMLEALEAFLHYDSNDDVSDVTMMLDYADALEKAKAAVAKARAIAPNHITQQGAI